MSELEYILNQSKKIFIEIRPSKIVKNGVGLVAIRSIPKDTTLFQYKNEAVYPINYDELRSGGVPLSVFLAVGVHVESERRLSLATCMC